MVLRSLGHEGMCGLELPTTLDWGPQGSGKHVEAHAGPCGAQAATNQAKQQRCGQGRLGGTGVEPPPGQGVEKAPVSRLHAFLMGGSQEGPSSCLLSCPQACQIFTGPPASWGWNQALSMPRGPCTTQKPLPRVRTAQDATWEPFSRLPSDDQSTGETCGHQGAPAQPGLPRGRGGGGLQPQ